MRCGLVFIFVTLLIPLCYNFKIGYSISDKWPIKVDLINTQIFIDEIREECNKTLKYLGEKEIPGIKVESKQYGLISTANIDPGQIIYKVSNRDCITAGDIDKEISESSLWDSYSIAKEVLEILSTKLENSNELPLNISKNERKLFVFAYALAVRLFDDPECKIDYLDRELSHLPLTFDMKTLELLQDKLLIEKILKYRRCLDELSTIPFGVDQFLMRIDRELGLSVYRYENIFSPSGSIMKDYRIRSQERIEKLRKAKYPSIDATHHDKFKQLLYSAYATICSYNLWPNFGYVTDPDLKDCAVGIFLADRGNYFSDEPLLAPVLGFTNHSSDPNAYIETSLENGESINLISARRIKEGEQVLINYGNYPNYLFYLNHGFVPVRNPHNLIYLEANPDLILKAARDLGYSNRLPTCYPRGLPVEKLNLIDKLNVFDKVEEINWGALYKNPHYEGVPLITFQEHVTKFGERDPMESYLNPVQGPRSATKINIPEDNYKSPCIDYRKKLVWIGLEGEMDPRLEQALKISLCKKKSLLHKSSLPDYQCNTTVQILRQYLMHYFTKIFHKTHLDDIAKLYNYSESLNPLWYSLTTKLQILKAAALLKNRQTT